MYNSYPNSYMSLYMCTQYVTTLDEELPKKTSGSRICFTLHYMSLADNPFVCRTWLYDLFIFTVQIRQFFNYVLRVRVTYKIRHESSGDGLKAIKLMILESSDFIK